MGSSPVLRSSCTDGKNSPLTNTVLCSTAPLVQLPLPAYQYSSVLESVLAWFRLPAYQYSSLFEISSESAWIKRCLLRLCENRGFVWHQVTMFLWQSFPWLVSSSSAIVAIAMTFHRLRHVFIWTHKLPNVREEIYDCATSTDPVFRFKSRVANNRGEKILCLYNLLWRTRSGQNTFAWSNIKFASRL